MNITFKYVGQGDTIFVEWNSDGREKLGIIDCKRYGGVVPGLDRVRGRESIQFIVLSHPHSDHYSGFPRLLTFCEKEGIEIGVFIYTTREIPSYIRSVVLSDTEKDDLADTFRAVRRLEEKGLLSRRGIGTDAMRPLDLTEEVTLNLLAPSETERDLFTESLYDADLNISDIPNANYVSAVSLIEGNEWQVILTSDAEKSALRRIGLGPLKKDYTPLILGQSPHHGSKDNHYRAFWRNRKHKTGTPIAISVGPNGYGHPSKEVIQDLAESDYDVVSTHEGAVGSETEKLRAEQDMISSSLSESHQRRSASDLLFQIEVDSGDVEYEAIAR